MRGRGGFVIVCLIAAIAPLRTWPRSSAASDAFPGWPSDFEGRPLRALTLSEREQLWSRDFPGRVGRFTDGHNEIVLRWLARETRQLHPAADCFRALGYAIAPQPLVVDSTGAQWGCFLARRSDEKLRVRERMADETGQSWSDVSAWFWSATLRRSRGPWWAWTVAERK